MASPGVMPAACGLKITMACIPSRIPALSDSRSPPSMLLSLGYLPEAEAYAFRLRQGSGDLSHFRVTRPTTPRLIPVSRSICLTVAPISFNATRAVFLSSRVISHRLERRSIPKTSRAISRTFWSVRRLRARCPADVFSSINDRSSHSMRWNFSK